MELVANWGARPVFIISKFHMWAERDWLWDFVLPAIEARLRRRRRQLEWNRARVADPNSFRSWASRSASVSAWALPGQAKVLKVCLDEVRRSRRFLIALIGDRYGRVPPRDRAEYAAGEAGITGDVAGCRKR
jgi:hypothetical protein